MPAWSYGSSFESYDASPHAALQRFEDRRTRQLVAGIYGGCVVGAVYGFGIFAEPLKRLIDGSQSDVAIITTAAFILGQFSLPAGLLYDRYGPRAVNLVAFHAIAVGFAVMAMIFARVVDATLVSVTLAYAIACWPSGFIDVGTIMPNLYTFPLNRGEVVIIQKTFMGLGTAFFSALFAGFFNNEHLAWYCACVAVVSVATAWGTAYFIRLPDDTSEIETRRTVRVPMPPRVVRAGIAMMLVAAAYLLTIALLEGFNVLHTWPEWGRVLSSVGAVLLLAAFMLLVPFSAEERHLRRYAGAGAALDDDDNDGTSTAMNDTMGGDTTRGADDGDGGDDGLPPHAAERTHLVRHKHFRAHHDGDVDAKRRSSAPPTTSPTSSYQRRASDTSGKPTATSPPFATICRKYDTPLCDTLRSAEFWMLFAVSFVVFGTGTTLTSNVAQIYRASNDNRFDCGENALIVSLGGIGSAAGRAVAGLLDSRYRHVSMTLYLAVPCSLNAIGLCAMLVLHGRALAAPFFLTSAANGAYWSFVILAVSMMFRYDVGKVYTALFTSGMLATIVFNLGIFGPLYDREAKAKHQAPDCGGVECYGVSFAVMACCNVAAACVAVALHRRFLEFQCGDRGEAAAAAAVVGYDDVSRGASSVGVVDDRVDSSHVAA